MQSGKDVPKQFQFYPGWLSSWALAGIWDPEVPQNLAYNEFMLSFLCMFKHVETYNLQMQPAASSGIATLDSTKYLLSTQILPPPCAIAGVFQERHWLLVVRILIVFLCWREWHSCFSSQVKNIALPKHIKHIKTLTHQQLGFGLESFAQWALHHGPLRGKLGSLDMTNVLIYGCGSILTITIPDTITISLFWCVLAFIYLHLHSHSHSLALTPILCCK